MEGFWTIQFHGIQSFGAGVVTLIGGQVFGGDSGYLYTGRYTTSGGMFKAMLRVRQHFFGVSSAMGQSVFDLELTGSLNGNKVVLKARVPGMPAQFHATMTKQQDLPASAARSQGAGFPR